MRRHSKTQLQKMFEEFGLGSDEDRQRFLDMSKGGSEPSKQRFILRWGDSSDEAGFKELEASE